MLIQSNVATLMSYKKKVVHSITAFVLFQHNKMTNIQPDIAR